MCGLAEQPLTNAIYDGFRVGPAGNNSAPDPVCSLLANFVAGEPTRRALNSVHSQAVPPTDSALLGEPDQLPDAALASRTRKHPRSPWACRGCQAGAVVGAACVTASSFLLCQSTWRKAVRRAAGNTNCSGLTSSMACGQQLLCEWDAVQHACEPGPNYFPYYVLNPAGQAAIQRQVGAHCGCTL